MWILFSLWMTLGSEFIQIFSYYLSVFHCFISECVFGIYFVIWYGEQAFKFFPDTFQLCQHYIWNKSFPPLELVCFLYHIVSSHIPLDLLRVLFSLFIDLFVCSCANSIEFIMAIKLVLIRGRVSSLTIFVLKLLGAIIIHLFFKGEVEILLSSM